MDFKKLFENNKAVSPVIGVILMVAITVILAAAIGSSVFGQGTTKAAPKANFDIKAADITGGIASIKIEHLGGDPIHFDKDTVTKVMASVNGGTAVQIASEGAGTGYLETMGVGDVKTLQLKLKTGGTALQDTTVTPAEAIGTGDTVNIKFIDVQTNQIVCDKDIRFS